MSKQTISIEVDVPDGWEYSHNERRGSICAQERELVLLEGLILRKVELTKHKRTFHANIYREEGGYMSGVFYENKGEAIRERVPGIVASPSFEIEFTEGEGIEPKKPPSVREFVDLIKHAHIHSGYRSCGYDQMTTEQKQIYDDCVNGVEFSPRAKAD